MALPPLLLLLLPTVLSARASAHFPGLGSGNCRSRDVGWKLRDGTAPWIQRNTHKHTESERGGERERERPRTRERERPRQGERQRDLDRVRDREIPRTRETE